MNPSDEIANRIDLDGEWEFTYTPGTDFSSRGMNPWTGVVPDAGHLPCADEFDAVMPAPGYWDDHLDSLRPRWWWAGAKFNPKFRPIEFPLGFDSPDASLSYLLGTGWYRREFFVPENWKDGIVSLYLGGVVMEGRIWINRRAAGTLLWHSTPWELRIDGLLKHGETNEVIIAVSNTREDRMGCNIRGYPGRSGGLYRKTCISRCGAAEISDFHLYRAGDTLKWSTELKGEFTSDAQIVWSIADHQSGIQMGGGTCTVSGAAVGWQTDCLALAAWSDHSPVLYDITLELRQDGKACHTVTRPFGMRVIEVKGRNLFLNGNPVMLRGATEHHYFPLTCTAPIDVNFYVEFLRKLKRLGFNWLRFHTWIPSEEYMEAADRLGFMIQVEPARGFTDEEWAAIVRLGRKHPSVVIYCCGNEEVINEEKIEELRRASGIMHALAPDALFSPMEALRGIEYGAESQMGEGYLKKPFLFNPKRLEKVNAFSDVFGSFAQGKLSYWSAYCNWREVDEWMAMYSKPILSHEVGILGSYMNLDLEHRYQGTRTGPELYAAVRRNLERAGLMARAPLYYNNSCKWLAVLRKHCLESLRKCGNIAGYDLLGAKDHQWHRCGYPCGILNDFDEMKPGETAENVLKYNGESVLLLDHTNFRNFRCGEKVDYELYASLYGEKPLTDGQLDWHVKMDGKIIYRQHAGLGFIPNGAVSTIGRITFNLPLVAQPQKITVCVRLSGGEYEIVNDWDFWVFPHVELKEPKEVRVVNALDAEAIRLLREGGRVLLLGGAPFKTMPTMFHAAQSGRANGDMATVITDHPVFDGFPHEGFCDWQFYTMLEGGCTVEFNDLSIPYEPILEVASSFKETLKKALMFEVGVGNGRLLVCSLNIDTHDPAAAWLLDRIYRYCAGGRFRPKYRMEAEELTRLLDKPHKPVAMPKTDIADDYNVR